jgi:hypothetical protein
MALRLSPYIGRSRPSRYVPGDAVEGDKAATYRCELPFGFMSDDPRLA